MKNVSVLIFILVIICFQSCDDNNINKSQFESEKYNKLSSMETIFGIYKNKLRTFIKSEEHHPYYVYNGDVLVHMNKVVEISAEEVKIYMDNKPEYESLSRAYTTKETKKIFPNIEEDAKLWEGGVVFFAIDKKSIFTINQLSIIFKAMSNWANKTNIRFKVIDQNENLKHILIKKVSVGCMCTIGSPEDVGSMHLSKTCDLQSVTHEIGHAVGLIHEHQRPLRENYLTTINKNEYKRLENELKKEGLDARKHIGMIKYNIDIVKVYDDSYPYDFNSVMHYGSWPRNNSDICIIMQKLNIPVFKRKDNGELIARPTYGLTAGDIDKVNASYFR